MFSYSWIFFSGQKVCLVFCFILKMWVQIIRYQSMKNTILIPVCEILFSFLISFFFHSLLTSQKWIKVFLWYYCLDSLTIWCPVVMVLFWRLEKSAGCLSTCISIYCASISLYLCMPTNTLFFLASIGSAELWFTPHHACHAVTGLGDHSFCFLLFHSTWDKTVSMSL